MEIDSGAGDNTIGGTSPGAANVVSGNANDGVELSGAGTSDNIVAGNDIGTDSTGTLALGNSKAGIEDDSSATDNTIGGTWPPRAT